MKIIPSFRFPYIMNHLEGNITFENSTRLNTYNLTPFCSAFFTWQLRFSTHLVFQFSWIYQPPLNDHGNRCSLTEDSINMIALMRIIWSKDKKVNTMLCVQVIVRTLKLFISRPRQNYQSLDCLTAQIKHDFDHT